MCPAESFTRFACIPHKDLHFSRAEVAGIDFDQDSTRGCVIALLLKTFATPLYGDSDLGEGAFNSPVANT